MTKSKELFVKICESEYNRLRKNENYIFENINLAFNWDNKYEAFKKSSAYYDVLNENSDYEKMKIIKDYFYNDIFELVEGMYLKANDLPITSELLLENTYDNLFKIVKKNVNLESLEFFENAFLNLDEKDQLKLIEEFNFSTAARTISNGVTGTARTISNGVTGTFKFAKKVAYDAVLFIESLKYIFDLVLYLPLKIPSFDDFLNDIIVLDKTFKPIIKKELSLAITERPELKDFFDSELNTDVKDIMKSCWENNMKTININTPAFINSHPIFYKIYSNVKTFFYKRVLRPDLLKTNIDKKRFLKEVKSDNMFNKMLSNYRICLFNNISDYLQSYAQVSFDIGDVESKLIKRLENIKQQRNSVAILKTYKEFFNIVPKNKAEKVFVLSVSNLIYLKEMLLMSKKEADDVAFYDRYFKSDLEVSIKKIDQSLQNIIDAYSPGKPQRKQYEESFKDNKEKKLVGNEPTKEKKISVFDI